MPSVVKMQTSGGVKPSPSECTSNSTIIYYSVVIVALVEWSGVELVDNHLMGINVMGYQSHVPPSINMPTSYQ